MATVKSYQNASGKTVYAVRYRKPDGRMTWRRGFNTKREASQFANHVEVSKDKGEYIAPTMGRVTVAELADDWLARKKPPTTAKSHYRMLESAWRVHVKDRWGSVPVTKVNAVGIEQWIIDMTADGSGTTTILRAYGVLSGILAFAVKSKLLSANPANAKDVENLPRKTRRRHVYLSADDVERLADESGQHQALVLTLAYTGIRWGEAVALRKRDVEFLKRRLAVNDNAVQLGVDHAVGLTKGRKSRSVPVAQFVLDELSRQCQGKDFNDLVFGDGEHYLPRPKSSGGWFAGAVKRAEVQSITPHDLRHTCASLAVSAGVNVLALQRMLGHTSAKMTLDTYADLFDDDLDAVAESLQGRYAPKPGLKCVTQI